MRVYRIRFNARPRGNPLWEHCEVILQCRSQADAERLVMSVGESRNCDVHIILGERIAEVSAQ